MKIKPATILLRTLPVAIAAAALWLWVELRPIAHPPGILVDNSPATLPSPPIPLPIREGAQALPFKRVAQVHAQGRVLSIQRYRDEMASTAPIDVVIGWGQMSDSKVIKQLKVTQADRKHHLGWSGTAPLTPKEAADQTANLHLIPGTPEAAQWISSLKPGMLVDLRGCLVAEAGEADREETPSQISNPLGANAAHGINDGAATPEAATDLPPVKGDCLFYLSKGYDFEGRSQQDLRAHALRDYEAQETADLKQWFTSLEERRKTLDANDVVAVREFNREAARYMELAHPGRLKGRAAALAPQP